MNRSYSNISLVVSTESISLYWLVGFQNDWGCSPKAKLDEWSLKMTGQQEEGSRLFLLEKTIPISSAPVRHTDKETLGHFDGLLERPQ